MGSAENNNEIRKHKIKTFTYLNSNRTILHEAGIWYHKFGFN